MYGGDTVAFSPDGKRLATTTHPSAYPRNSQEIKVWDAQTGQELLTFQGRTGMFTSVLFSPDGKRLVSSAGEVKVWDAQTGLELLSFKGGGFGSSAAFTQDGHRLVSSVGRTVTIYDATPVPEK
jgi:WD40 repeat protein